MRAYQDARRKSGDSAATVNREVAALGKHVHARLVKAGRLTTRPPVRRGWRRRRHARASSRSPSTTPSGGISRRSPGRARLLLLDRLAAGDDPRPDVAQEVDLTRETDPAPAAAHGQAAGQRRVTPRSPALRGVIERRLTKRRLDTPLVFHVDGRPMGDWRKRWAPGLPRAGLHLAGPRRRRRSSVRQSPPRHAAHRRPEPDADRTGPRAGRDGADRPQDPLGRVRPPRHRQRARPPGRGTASRRTSAAAHDAHVVPIRRWPRAPPREKWASSGPKSAGSAWRTRFVLHVIEAGGAPSRIRTCDLRIRSPTLYPTELWARPAAPGKWRRGRDSNPGPGSTPGNRLAGGCLRPTRPPLRAQRPHLLGGYNLCQLSGRPWDGWRRGRDSNPRGLAPIPVFKTGAFNRSATPPVSGFRVLP